jgi:YrbI family 3-deoxy-D-manno-octulosonate 8-phosphate phosphatase
MINYLISDCDGVLTDGKYYYSKNGKELITFNAKDSLAIKLFLQDGIIPIIISSTTYPEIITLRAKEWGAEFYSVPVLHKAPFVSDRFVLSNIMYVGDSLDDIDLLKIAKMSFCPSDSPNIVKTAAKQVLVTPSGNGCLLEIYLRINNKWEK